MNEELIIHGDWFIPSKPESKYHGILSFNPIDGAELKVFGNFLDKRSLNEMEEQAVILGISSDSKLITLYKCMITEYSNVVLVQGQVGGKPSTTFSPVYVFVGAHINSEEEMHFDTVYSEIFNLDEWLNISGFQRDRKKEQRALKKHERLVKYKTPETIVFDISENAIGKFEFYADIPSIYAFQKSASINQKVKFVVTLKNQDALEKVLEYVFIFQNFLILCLYNVTTLLSIVLESERHIDESEDGRKVKRKIKVYFSANYSSRVEKPKLAREMVISYPLIKDRFLELIKAWYSKYQLLKPAFNLVFEQFYSANRFTSNNFLNLAQSAETFHARLHNHTKMTIEDYDEMKNEILRLSPIQYHKWLKEQFNWGNNLNLHARLTELVQKYSNKTLDKIIGDKDQFVKQVKYSRNYYTHYSSSAKKHALFNSELFYLSERLKILLVCSFLMEIGILAEELSSSMNNLKWKLFYHLADWRNDEDSEHKIFEKNMNLKGGALLIGSLFWDRDLLKNDKLRMTWRDDRLLMNDAIKVRIPIRYGRLSGASKSKIFTMVFSTSLSSTDLGEGYLVPFKNNPIRSVFDVNIEMSHLARAEGMNKGFIATTKNNELWAVMGILFNENKVASLDKDRIIGWWKKHLKLDFDFNKFQRNEFKHGGEEPSIKDDCQLNLSWPVESNDNDELNEFDFLLAAITLPTGTNYPSIEEIAETVRGDLKRKYFINNVKNGITTFQDAEVLNQLSI